MKTKTIIIFLISITLFSCKSKEEKKKDTLNYLRDKIDENKTQWNNIFDLLQENETYNEFDVTSVDDINSDTYFQAFLDSENFELAQKDSLKGDEKFNHTLFVYCNNKNFTPSDPNVSNSFYSSTNENFVEDNYIDSFSDLIKTNKKIKNDNKKFTDSLSTFYEFNEDKTQKEINDIFHSLKELKYIAFIKYKYVLTPSFVVENYIKTAFNTGYVQANVKVFETKSKAVHKEYKVYAQNSNNVTYRDDEGEAVTFDLFKKLEEQVKYKLYYNKK